MVYRIGLTGNIGCGKSAVGELLRGLGADYADADAVVHQLLGPGGPAVAQVAERFGQEVLAPDGSVDRKRLAAIAFSDRAALHDLEELLHPAVRAELRRRIAESNATAIVIDAIKLIEGGLSREVDSVWVVTCPPAEQRRRLIELRGMTVQEAEARIASQPPQEDKLKHATVVIDNGSSIDETRRQVIEAWARTVGATIST